MSGSWRSAAPWVLGCLLLGAGVGTALHVSKPAQQVATAAVELTAVAPVTGIGPAALSGRPATVDTDAQILRSDAVVRPVAEVSQRSPSQAREALSASARPLTRVLEITYAAPTQAAAVAGAQRAAEMFLQLRQELILGPNQQFLESIAGAPVTPLPPGIDQAPLAPDDPSSLQATQEDRAFALALELPTAGSVLEQARSTTVGDRGDAEVPIASGASLGALLGFGAWRSRRPTVRARAVSRSGGAPPGPAGPLSAARRPAAVRMGGHAVTRRRRPLVRAAVAAVLAVAGLAVGTLLGVRLAGPVSAEVSLRLTPLPGNAFASRAGNTLVDLGTESSLALSDPVLRQAAGPDTADREGLRRRLSVRLVPSSEVVVVRAVGDTPVQVATDATRVGQAVLAVREARSTDAEERLRSVIETRIAKTEVESERAGRAGDLKAAKVLAARLVTLREDYKALLVSQASAGSVLTTDVLAPRVGGGLRLALALGCALLAAAVGLFLCRPVKAASPWPQAGPDRARAAAGAGARGSA